MKARFDTYACLQEFHHAVAEEVRGPFSRGGMGGSYSDRMDSGPGRGGRGGGRRDYDRGDVDGDGGGRGGRGEGGRRAAPAPFKPDPVLNPRNIEAVVKLRGLPFEATPGDVADWINEKIRSREAFLSTSVRHWSLARTSVPCNVDRGAVSWTTSFQQEAL